MCHGDADRSVCVSSVPDKEHISQGGHKEVMQEQQHSKSMASHRSLIKDENSREQLSLGMSLWQLLSEVSKKILVCLSDLMFSYWWESQTKLKSWTLPLERGTNQSFKNKPLR